MKDPFSAHFWCKICYFCLKSSFEIIKIHKIDNFYSLKMSKSCWLIILWFKQIPGIKRYDVRLSSPKRVWDAPNSSFLYRDFRKSNFSPLQLQRDFPPKSYKIMKMWIFEIFWYSKICKIMIAEFFVGQANTGDRKVWCEAFIP